MGARQSNGLCATCIHAAGCVLCADRDHLVFRCEEFDCASSTERKPEDSDGGRASSENLESDQQWKGLCMNCENRFSCSFPKPEDGVWHCAEYR
jgi:hypothetical protein